MIADFAWLTPQTGWLECDGTDVNTTTYSALYNVMTIQMTGSRTSGNASITSLSSTANMRVGYFVFGTGISSGTTIAAINSSTQITLSTNSSSTGTSTIAVSPWVLNTGTIRLPDLKTAGRFRRTVKPGGNIGETQQDLFGSHSHTVSGSTSTESSFHTHNFSGNTGGMSGNNPHSHPVTGGTLGGTTSFPVGGPADRTMVQNPAAIGVGATDINHTHFYAGETAGNNTLHFHAVNLTTNVQGSSETRPLSAVFMTCVKT